MAIEGLDAALPIETGGFVPLTAMPEEADTEPTLDDARREFALAGRAPGAHRAGGGAAADEGSAPDLWVTDAMRGVARPAIVEATADAGGGSAPAPGDEAPAPQDHPLVKERLTLAELGHMIANRQYDSTDYTWEEMSSGDYEWALQNFKDDVYAAVREVTRGATSQPQADQMAQAYLNSIGLGGTVHVGPPPDPDDDAIVVTAQIYDHPDNYMTLLSLDRPGFDNFDPHTVYDILDVSAHTITVEVDTPLTAQQLAAVETLRVKIEQVTQWLNSLPANGTFTFPDGKVVTVAELRQLWARADFVVTNRTFNNGPGNSLGGGAANWNGGDPVFEVNVDRLTTQYMANDWNATWYILHELAHVTFAGVTINTEINADHVRTQQEYDMNEAFATATGIAIAEAAGYQFISSFLQTNDIQYNLGLVPRPTFSVPATGGGGGGGGEVPYQ